MIISDRLTVIKIWLEASPLSWKTAGLGSLEMLPRISRLENGAPWNFLGLIIQSYLKRDCIRTERQWNIMTRHLINWIVSETRLIKLSICLPNMDIIGCAATCSGRTVLAGKASSSSARKLLINKLIIHFCGPSVLLISMGGGEGIPHPHRNVPPQDYYTNSNVCEEGNHVNQNKHKALWIQEKKNRFAIMAHIKRKAKSSRRTGACDGCILRSYSTVYEAEMLQGKRWWEMEEKQEKVLQMATHNTELAETKDIHHREKCLGIFTLYCHFPLMACL